MWLPHTEPRGRELAAGIDTFVTSMRGQLPRTVQEMLATAKSEARDIQGGLIIGMGSYDFEITPGSMGFYPFHLITEWGHLGLTPSTHLPTARWQPRAEVIHSLGPRAATGIMADIVADIIGPPDISVSRMDLHADFQGFGFVREDEENFVSRSRLSNAYYESLQMTSVNFGSRKTRSINARLYNKTKEMSDSGVSYLPLLWGGRFDPSEAVWRMEFELHKAALSQFNLSEVDDAISKQKETWSYLCNEWLSLRIPTADETRSRWPVDPRWACVEAASFEGGSAHLERVRERIRQDSLVQAVGALYGQSIRVASLIGATDLRGLLNRMPVLFATHEKRRHKVFSDEIRRRRIEKGMKPCELPD